MSQFTLVTARVCPFAHRAFITASILGVEFDHKRVLLDDKPAWFTELYKKAHGADPASDGKVPTLQDGDFILTESAVVADYLAAKFGPEKNIDLLPKTPKERALYSLFLSQDVGQLVAGYYGLLRAQEVDAQTEVKNKLLDTIAGISKKLQESSGPFVLGERMTLADVFCFTIAYRFGVLKHYRGFEIPNDTKYEAFNRLKDTMRNHPGVAATLDPSDTDHFVEGYASFANPAK